MEVESQGDVQSWYLALHRGDCATLHRLLCKDPQLLKVGRKQDRTRDLEGNPLEQWIISPEERSAVERERSKQREQYLVLGDVSPLQQRWAIAAPSERMDQQGNESMIPQPGIAELMEQASAMEFREHWMGCTALHKAVVRGSLQLVRKVLDLFNGEFFSETGPTPGPPLSLTEFLFEEDGVIIRQEALGLAMVNGNPSIIHALSEASLQSETNPYGIDPEKRNGRISTTREDAMQQQLLRKIALDVIESFEKSEERVTVGTDAESVIKYAFSDDDWKGSAELRDRAREEILRRINGRYDSEQLRRTVHVVVNKGWTDPVQSLDEDDDDQNDSGVKEMLKSLKSIIQEVIMSNGGGFTRSERVKIKLSYSGTLDFNFLPLDIYLFHFTFAQNGLDRDFLQRIRQKILESIARHSESRKIRKFLMTQLMDGRGRTALHVAVSNTTIDPGSQSLNVVSSKSLTNSVNGSLSQNPNLVSDFLELLGEGKEEQEWVNTVDAMGRTPLFRAAAECQEQALDALLKHEAINVEAKFDFAACHDKWEDEGIYWGRSRERSRYAASQELPPDVENLVDVHAIDTVDLSRLTALQIAILHRHSSCVQALVDRSPSLGQAVGLSDGRSLALGDVFWHSLQLATVVGHLDTVDILLEHLKKHNNRKGKQLMRWEESMGTTPAILLAAGSTNYKLVRKFLDIGEENYDPFITDRHGNTAMHFMAKCIDFPFSLLHCVTLDSSHIMSYHLGNLDHRPFNIISAERQGCIEMLIQAGFDPWDVNNENEPPNPSSLMQAPTDRPPNPRSFMHPGFLAWWYDTLQKQTSEEQTTLKNSANAIAVTATLVATASFVGPLQPPLGYVADPSTGYATALQSQIMAVRVFIVCDTLSFFLAVAALLCAVIPFLPILHEGVRKEISHARKIVAFAVGFLFPAIICIVVAFVGSSIAVIPDDGKGGGLGLKISTCIVGVLGCVAVMYIFFLRLLRFVFPETFTLRKAYRDPYFVKKLRASRWYKTSKRVVLGWFTQKTSQ